MKFLSKKNYDFISSYVKDKYNSFDDINIKYIMNYIEEKHKTIPLKKKEKMCILMIKKLIDKKVNEKLNKYDNNEDYLNHEVSTFEKDLKEETKQYLNFVENRQEEVKIEKTYEINVFKDFDEKYKKMKTEDEEKRSKQNYYGDTSLFIDIPDPVKKILKDIEENKLYNDHYVLIDSRQRNHDSYEINDYCVDLEEEYDNILFINMKQINLPNSDYIINSSNNKITIEESINTPFDVVIQEGNYNISELLTEIENTLNTTLDSTYTVSTSTHSKMNDFYTGPSNDIMSSGGDSWKLFDNDNNTRWDRDNVSNYVIYKLPKDSILTRYTFITTSLTRGRPTDWTVEISNDLNNWTTVDTKVGEVYSSGFLQDITISNSLASKYIRFTITQTSNSTDLSMSELTFYKDDTSKINISSDLSGGDSIFNLYFNNDNTLRNILGYQYDFYTSSSFYITENNFNLGNFNNNIYMYFNNYDLVNKLEDDFFQIIPLKSDKNKYTTYKPETTLKTVYYPKWKTSLKKLKIKYTRFDKTLYNFNGLDHDMILHIRVFNIKN